MKKMTIKKFKNLIQKRLNMKIKKKMMMMITKVNFLKAHSRTNTMKMKMILNIKKNQRTSYKKEFKNKEKKVAARNRQEYKNKLQN